MTTQGCSWSRYSGDSDREIAHTGMQPNQGAKTVSLGTSHSWEDGWWPIESALEQEIPQHETVPCRADIGLCSTNSWHQPHPSQPQRRALLNNERQRDNIARIERLLYDYQHENVRSESDQWTSEPVFQGLPLPNMPSQADGHDRRPRSQRCCLSHPGHSETALDRTEPSIGDETFSMCDSKFGTHSADDFSQDVWETGSSREYTWSSPLTVPYSIFGEGISQCYGSNSHGSNNGWWDQKQVGESDGQSIKVEPLSRLDGLYFPSFCGNWMDDSAAIGQHYDGAAKASTISPGPLEGFQNTSARCMRLPEDLLYLSPVSVGEVTSDNDEKVPSFSSRQGANISSQSTNSSQEAVFVAAESCLNTRFEIRPRVEETLHDPPSVSPRLDNQMTHSAGSEVQYRQQKQPLNQPSSRPPVPKPIHPKLSSGERNWRSSSLESRSALTRRSSPRSRTNPSGRAAQRKIVKDQFLIESKFAGMSYKEIREKGNFSEAESTLRGRFRTLTKEKGQRVRKPEWEEEDIRLLQQAVEDLTASSDRTQALSSQINKNVKIPWKQVAEYIARHGGSYHFGNATCRKKWDETNRSLNDEPLGKANGEQR